MEILQQRRKKKRPAKKAAKKASETPTRRPVTKRVRAQREQGPAATALKAAQELDPSVELLKVEEIEVKDRIRQDLGDINELASSIAEIGQIHPIRVAQNGAGKPLLIAGYRRMRACAQLGIPVRAEVVKLEAKQSEETRQVDENIKRKNFDRLEEAEALQRLKSMYEAKYPETKLGAAGGGRGGKGVRTKTGIAKTAKPVPRFTQAAKQSYGYSERSVQELLAIANLPRRYKKKIEEAKTTAERNKVAQECLKLVREDAKQKKLVEKAEARKQMQLDEAGQPERPPITLHYGRNEDFLRGEELFELILTDPPYDREKSLISHVARASMNPEKHEWDKLDVGWVMRAAPTLTKGGTIVVFCPLEAIGAYEVAFQAAELQYRGAMVWIKSNPAPVHRPVYASAVEGIVWATKPGAQSYFNPEHQKAGAESMNVFTGPGVVGSAANRLHPTQKPDWLIQRLITNHADSTARVCDPFAGSGTTGVVCQKMGLECRLIECDEEYVKTIKLRLGAGE